MKALLNLLVFATMAFAAIKSLDYGAVSGKKILGTDDPKAADNAGTGKGGKDIGVSEGYGLESRFGDIVGGNAFLYLEPAGDCREAESYDFYNLDCFDFVIDPVSHSSKLPKPGDMHSDYKSVATASKAEAMLVSLDKSTNKLVTHKQTIFHNALEEYRMFVLRHNAYLLGKCTYF